MKLAFVSLLAALVPLARGASVFGVRPECKDFFCGKSELVAFSFDVNDASKTTDHAVLIAETESKYVRSSQASGSGTASTYELFLFDASLGHARVVTLSASTGTVLSDVKVDAIKTRYDTAVRTAAGWAVTSGPVTAIVDPSTGAAAPSVDLWPSTKTGLANAGVSTTDASTIAYEIAVDAKGGTMNVLEWNVTAATVGASPDIPYGGSSFGAAQPLAMGWEASGGSIVGLGQTVGGLLLVTANPKTFNVTEVWGFEAFVGYAAGPSKTCNVAASGAYYMTVTMGGGGSGTATLGWLGVDLTTRKQLSLSKFKFDNTPALQGFAVVG